MMSATQTSAAPKAARIDIKKSLVDTVLAGLIALIVFGPILATYVQQPMQKIVTDRLRAEGEPFRDAMPPRFL